MLLRSDILRKELLATATYADDEKQSVYDEMSVRARHALLDGRDVVLDAAFNKSVNREKAAELATMLEVSSEAVLVTSSEETIRERLLRREGGENDADWQTYQLLKPRFEPIDEPHVIIANDGDLTSLEKEVRKLLL